jgi:integrase
MGKLTAAGVKVLHRDGRYPDGQGLFLDVRGGSRAWLYRYQLDKRARSMSLGNADAVSLADARKAHAEARAMVLRKLDPLTAREQARATVPDQTFAAAADAYIAVHAAGWRSPRSATVWRQTLQDHVLPHLGSMAVGGITRDDVMKVLAPIWTVIPETASRIRSRIELVLDYSTARGWRDGPNPALWRGGLASLLPRTARVRAVVQHPALPWRDAPVFMARLAGETSIQARALRFLILTAARSGEVRGMLWSEVDLATATWTIPASRMKAGRLHRVPLSGEAMDILLGMQAIRSGDVVFPSRVGGPLADSTLVRVIRRKLAERATDVHGFRSCFRDWCADTGKSWEAAEAALAHASGNAVARAYQRSDLLDSRRGLMEQWGRFLTQPPAEVVAFPTAA